jgi:hypothetical protein|tara:strand:+ start:1229 stop:1687 length:459 start_codon:yes stop_codon:yes gene_type:complete
MPPRVDDTNDYKKVLDSQYWHRVSIVMARTMKGQDGLTYKQRLLVDTLVTSGCTITEAAKKAGYSKTESGRVIASRTLRIPKVQEYYRQQVAEIGLLGSIPAVKTLVRLSSEAKSDYVKLEASKDILDRSGFKAPQTPTIAAANLSIKIDID